MTTKTTNLTFAELWPLVRDGQCFEPASNNCNKNIFRYFLDGFQVWHWQDHTWQDCSGPSMIRGKLFHLIDDPSQPKEPEKKEPLLKSYPCLNTLSTNDTVCLTDWILNTVREQLPEMLKELGK